MFGNYGKTTGLETFNRGFGSARYNSTGSIYSILDSSKTFAATGKKILSFNTGDSAVQAQAKKYGVDKADYDASVVKAQLNAPDLLPKQKYAGGSSEEGEEVPGKEEEAVDETGYEAGGEEVATKRKAPKGLRPIKKSTAPKGGAEAGTEGEGEASEGSKGSDSDVSKSTVKSSRTITDTEAIGEEAYEALPEKASQSVLNRARYAKKVPFLKELDVRVDTTKTKPALRINVASVGERQALILIAKEEIAKGSGSANYKRFLSYLAGGTAFRIVPGAKSSEVAKAYLESASGKKVNVPKGHKKGKKEAAESKVFPPAAAVGGGGSEAAAAVAAELKEGSESDWEVVGKKKRGKGKGKA
jgi:hypothetical protein